MGTAIPGTATRAAALVVGLVARIVARQLARGGELTAWPVALAILASLAVLQGAAKLAVAVEWLHARFGVDPAAALGGEFRTAVFAASFVPIAAYVVTFLVGFRRVKGAV
ncbi:MAG: hypothetical protein KDK10_16680 [Maritimibacter sp.]|nr:hypothetical protein [Maritimibacter sp.]